MKSKKLYFSFLCIGFLAVLAMLCGRPYAADQPSLTPQMKIQPERFDLKCPYGSRLTCVISFPQGFDTADVNEDRIMLENEIKAKSITVLPNVIMARFSRCEVLPLLERKAKSLPGTVNLLVSGSLEDGAPFQAQGKVRVICPPRMDLAVKPCSIKSGEMVRVTAKCDEKLETLKVFIKQPGIGTKAVAVKMNYEEGSEFPYRYAGNIDTSDLIAGKAVVKACATDLAGEQRIRMTSVEVR